MKQLQLLICLLFYSPILIAQEGGSVPYADTAKSLNGKYQLVVKGIWCDDAPCGPQSLTLSQPFGDILWTIVLDGRSLFMPIVSNCGDVAECVGTKLTILSKTGSTKGIFDSRPLGFMADFFDMLQAFSPDSKYFYALLQSDPASVWLVVLSDSAKELHREDLGAFHPRSPRDFHTLKDKVIAYDPSWWPDSEYVNHCCVFNKDGELIWQYDQATPGRRWSVDFDQAKGILNILDGRSRRSIEVDTLQ